MSASAAGPSTSTASDVVSEPPLDFAAALDQIQEDFMGALQLQQNGAAHVGRFRAPVDRKIDRSSVGNVRIKMSYKGEKRSVHFRRPLRLTTLQAKLIDMYGRPLCIFYTVAQDEVIIPIRKQCDLDEAIALIDTNERARSLRLLLSKHDQADAITGADAGGADPEQAKQCGRFSPPPGSRAHRSGTAGSTCRYQPRRRRHRSRGAQSQRSDSSAVVGREVPYVSSASSIASSVADSTCHEFLKSFGRRSTPSGAQSPQSPSSQSHAHRSGPASSSGSSGMVPDVEPSTGAGSARSKGTTGGPRVPTNWRQGKCLGQGAFGAVFLAYDADTGRELAIKRVPLHYDNDGDGDKELRKEVLALENEIALLSHISHERVVQYVGFERSNEALCIFMEYLPGGSVRDELRYYGPLSPKVAAKYCRQILQGLAYLHEQYHIVHRDIKPANILRDGMGNVKIGDFGAAKRLATICSQTNAGTFVGTPYYMAPEVIEGRRYGRKADCWSLACTLVELLTGSPPWRDLEPMAAMFRIVFHTPVYTLPPHTPAQLQVLISILFERRHELRPSAAEALAHPALVSGDDACVNYA